MRTLPVGSAGRKACAPVCLARCDEIGVHRKTPFRERLKARGRTLNGQAQKSRERMYAHGPGFVRLVAELVVKHDPDGQTAAIDQRGVRPSPVHRVADVGAQVGHRVPHRDRARGRDILVDASSECRGR